MIMLMTRRQRYRAIMIRTIIYCHTHFSYGKGRGAVALEEMELPRGFVAFIFAF